VIPFAARHLQELISRGVPWAAPAQGLLAGTVLLGLLSAVTSIPPARHAAGADPMTALRCE